jgi:hypothetical protein
VVKDPVDGRYHAVVADFINECGEGQWWGNLQCSHITADVITGPWSKRDTAVPVWCHNPQLVPLHNGTYALFHLGLGTPPIHGLRQLHQWPTPTPR